MMNDKFIKLALNAGLLNYVDHETPRRYFVHGHAEQEEVEKFAELIVRECIVIVSAGISNATDWDSSYWDQACENRAQAIKQHFGV